jgi:hypothetical protein
VNKRTVAGRHGGVTKEKLLRDVEHVRAHARTVICLDENAAVCEVIDRANDPHPVCLIVVLAPIVYEHERVESIVLEIGYSRTRPYASVERDGVLFMAKRRRFACANTKQLASAYPAILHAMEEIVLRARQEWKYKDAWFLSGPGYLERGIVFTVAKEDRALYRQVLSEDVRMRRERYIDWHAKCIARWIGHYRHAGFSRQQLLLFSGARKVGELLSRYTSPFYREALLREFREGSLLHTLVEHIADANSIDLRSTSEAALLWGERDGVALPLSKNVRFRLRAAPSVHGAGCVVFEVTLEKGFREREECPF